MREGVLGDGVEVGGCHFVVVDAGCEVGGDGFFGHGDGVLFDAEVLCCACRDGLFVIFVVEEFDAEAVDEVGLGGCA